MAGILPRTIAIPLAAILVLAGSPFHSADADGCLETLGRWPYGPTRTVAAGGDHAYFASGPTVLIVDLSDPATPQVAGEIALLSTAEIAVSGDLTYLASEADGLQIYDVSTPAEPVRIGSHGLPERPQSIAVADDLAYVLAGGLRIFDVSTSAQPVEIGLVEMYGVDLAISGDHAYVVDGIGLTVANVSDPTDPVIIASVDTPGDSSGVATAGHYAYIADTFGGLRVIDVTYPYAPVEVASSPTSYSFDLAVVGDYAYMADNAQGLKVIDISVPTAPSLAGSVDTPGSALGVAANGGLAFVADNNQGLRVVDVNSPAAPTEVGFIDTPGKSVAVDLADHRAFVADRRSGLHILDVSDPTRPTALGFVEIVETNYGPQAVAVMGEFAYLANDDHGLRVIDFSDPTAPIEVGFVDSPGRAIGIATATDYAYLADHTEGLRVIDISNPQTPFEVASWMQRLPTTDVTVVAELAFVVGGGGLAVLDISSPAAPVEIGFIDYLGFCSHVAVSDGFAFLTGAGLRVVDVGDPTAPVEVGTFDHLASFQRVAVAGDHVYVTTGDLGVLMINISDPTNPTEVGSFLGPGFTKGVAIGSGLVATTHHDSGLVVYNEGCTGVFTDSFESGDTSAWSSVVPKANLW